MPERVRITDVSPRDGLQNEPGVIPTTDKVRLIELLCATGVDEIEVTSFVSPKWVPQLGDAAEVLHELRVRRDIELALFEETARRSPASSLGLAWKTRSPMLSSLIPNLKGMTGLLDTASQLGSLFIEKISVFTAASETFSTKNTNASIAETILRFRPVVEQAQSLKMQVRGYISCVIACPFEGPIDPAAVTGVADQLRDIGIDEIDLGDTIGAATPESTNRLLHATLPTINANNGWCTLHLHDTFGRAADCVKAALDLGVRSFDGSVAGLGGCPYASTPGKRAPGNISTETLVRTIHDAGYTTGVNLDALAEAAAFARKITGR